MVGNYELVAYTPANTKNYEFAGRIQLRPYPGCLLGGVCTC